MQIKNISGIDREIATKGYGAVVAAGDVADVPDEIGESLIEQTDVWERVEAPPKRAAKAADEEMS